MTETPQTTPAAALGERYRRRLAEHGHESDPAQVEVVRQLQRLHDEIAACPERGGVRRLLRRIAGRAPPPAPRGMYLWGGVGAGKTFLMDLFFETLPIERKQRLHFYRFMQEVHALLKRAHGRNPLETVAERLARRARVLCLDEFFVSDITDAMILHRLLREMFERRLVLVTTSNIAPPDLYKGGLQRGRFLPAIALLERHTRVVHLNARTDYRLRMLAAGEVYHHPCGRAADDALARSFRAISDCADGEDAGGAIEINGRDVPVVRHSRDTAWFDFKDICEGPRSPADYISIAHLYHSVLISNIPLFDRRDDAARRFIQLVDEFYDRNVKLIVSAAAAPAELYRDGRLAAEFSRAASRLGEMQSRRYLSQAHRG